MTLVPIGGCRCCSPEAKAADEKIKMAEKRGAKPYELEALKSDFIRAASQKWVSVGSPEHLKWCRESEEKSKELKERCERERENKMIKLLTEDQLNTIKYWKDNDEEMDTYDTYIMKEILSQVYIELHYTNPDINKAIETMDQVVPTHSLGETND